MTGFSIPAAIWGSLIGFSVLLAALAYLRATPNAPAGSGYWTAGLGLYVLRLLFYLLSGHLDPVFVIFVAESLQVTSSFLILAGTLRFCGNAMPPLLLPNAIVAAILWAAYSSLLQNDFLLRSVPLYGAAGAALIYGGYAMLKAHQEERIASARLVGIALIFWGLHKFDYPWLRPVEWFAPVGFLLAELFAMMAAVGLLLLTAGRLRIIAAEAEKRHEQSREHLATLNQLLQISLGNKQLDEQLSESLDVVIAAPWLSLEPRGAIFLVENGALKMHTHRNLAPDLLTTCARVEFGRCLCGRAAATREIVHAAHVDDLHENRYDGMRPHGHYSVPIVSAGEVLGILLLYLPDGRAKDDAETGHLRAVADVLAGMIVRKRAEDELGENRERLVMAQRIAHIGSWENDLRSGTSIWSDELFRILGFEPGEVEASFETYFALVHPEDRHLVMDAMAAIEQSGLFSVEHRIVHPDGTVLYVSELAEVVRDEAGKPIRMIGTTQNITQAKMTELALMKAKQGAETANQAKSSFLATMSHELRTPLNAVIGFAQLLERQAQLPLRPEKYREYVAHIRESGEHLLAVINDILDISRIEAGQAVLSEFPIDMADLVRRTTQLMQAKARDRGLHLELLVPANLPHLLGDERALKQILLNLIANALKFTERGGSVVVELTLVDDGLELSVCDTGIGIAPEDQERIFEPFVQADSELNRRYEGTGLGLPLVKSLAEEHGGRIRLLSAPGEGTRISVLFPAARLKYLEDQPQPQSSRAV